MSPSDEPAGGAEAPPEPSDEAYFDRTLLRVMFVQVLALLALALLQSRYNL